MPNTLTGFIPDLYEGLDIVSREMTGFIPSVAMNSSAERAAVNQTIKIDIVPASTASDITPAATPADNGDVVLGSVDMTISKSRYVPIRWTGEDEKGVGHSGMLGNIKANQVAQAVRTLVNEMETDLATEAALNASNSYGAVGTVPFTTNLAESAQILKLLKDNGAPQDDLSMVFDTTIGASFRTLGNVTKANEAGTIALREQGVLLDVHGMKLRESAQVQSHTAGTGSAYTTSGTALAVGETSIPIITGTGTVLIDDAVTFAGDTTQYIVKTGVAAPGTIVLEEPGLKVAIPASATAMTIVASHVANVAFDRNAIQFITRAPAMPEGGDMADDVVSVTDPRTGLTFEAALYKQYKRNKIELGISWGQKAIKNENIIKLLY
jgi:hypothetical protein